MSKWHSGPPPHVGWWNASRVGLSRDWRWWDGKCWSCSACENDQPKQAKATANIKVHASDQGAIMWTYDWPEGARVPRINTETGEVTGKVA